ncbi:hypothetical protein JW721_02525 [Candidatus Micrarchaeota archaeon]|jgi:hypothetical protein|nr:hypothetical protein [Candidatus Micrarchaeota archaeon]
MGEYREWETGNKVIISNLKTFEFPSTGAKVLFKTRPPIAKELGTD